jgi:hypothetical protein
MPKVTKTTARKDSPKACPQAKAGQAYYWWRTRMKGAKNGMTRCSLSYPKPSQLTMSDFWGAVYSLQEEIERAGPYDSVEDLEADRGTWADSARDIGSEQQDKLDNMPQQLQDGDTGQMIAERVEGCEDWATEIEAIDMPDRSNFDEGEDGDEEFAQALEETVGEIAGLAPSCG